MDENALKIKIIEKVKANILKYNMIEDGDSVVIGLSGGPDSVCMTHILSKLRSELGIKKLIAVHVNHELRGAESESDELYAKEIADRCRAEFCSFKVDVTRFARDEGIGTETAGRKLRYRIFDRIRKQFDVRAVAIAHNQDDQAETVLMRIIRGTGIKGLGGISYVRKLDEVPLEERTVFLKYINVDTLDAGFVDIVEEDDRESVTEGVIIRPLLDLTREEVENYCDICKLNPHIDHTNFLPIYTRNKLRLELIPLIEKEFNPEVKSALVRLSKQAEEDESFMYDMASNEWRRRWNDDKKNLSLKGFENMHRSIAKRVLFMCAAAVGLEKDIDAKHIENILGLVVEGEEARELDLTNHIYARYSYGKLWFLNRTDERGIIKEAVLFPFDELDKNSKAVLDIAKMRLILSIIHINEVNSVSSGSLILDYNRLNRYSAVYIRNRQAGDRIRVRGLNGTKKVQDFMTDRKIPKHERDRIPLIVADGEVVAVGGEAAENCCITTETDMVLTVEFR